MNSAPPAGTRPKADPLTERLERARHEARLTEAVWRRKRAELARLVAAGEEAAAARLVAAIERSPVAERVTQSPAAQPAPPKRQNSEPSRPSKTPTKTTANKKPAPAAAPVAPAKPKPKPSSKSAAKTAAARSVAVKKPSRRPKLHPRSHRARSSRARSKNAPNTPLPREAIRLRNRLAQGWLVSARDWTSRKPSWVLSLTAHLVILVALALLTFGSWTNPPLQLDAVFASDSEFNDVMPESTPIVELDATLDEPAEAIVELASLSAETLEPAPIELAAVRLSGDLLAGSADGLLDEIGTSTADEGAATSQPAAKPIEGSGESPGGVRFFGANDVASRVAFVVDNSGSMQRGRMETTLMELDRAVARLEPTQYFYVVLFSDQAYPMFFPQPADEMLPATRSNKSRLSKWLGTVEMCLGGRLLDAVEIAAAVEPQVVYLLTDGDIRSQRVVSQLSDGNAWDFTIHTLGMGVRTPQDAGKLQVIASANQGEFHPVRAHPEAIRRSQLRPIPYHNTQGKVWGSLVSSWK